MNRLGAKHFGVRAAVADRTPKNSNERSRNVIENKGTLWKGWSVSRNLYENSTLSL